MPLLKPIRGIQLNRTHPLARGLVGCWLFNEGSGGKAYDLSGYGNHGTLYNNTHSVPGKFGTALDFDGSADYVDLTVLNPHDYGAFTVLTWYKSDKTTVTDDEYIFAHVDGSGYPWIMLGPTDDSGEVDHAKFSFWDDTTGNSTHSTTDIVDQQWHQLVGVRTSNERLHVYVDGVKEGDVASNLSGVFTVDAEGPFIGDRPGHTEQVDGLIDHVMIWDRALTAGEIAQLYREPSRIFEGTIRPELIFASTAQVPLAGSASAQSAASATLKLLRKISGTVASNSAVTASLTSFQGLPGIERNWLREALFNGMTANAFKLGTTLSLGWFWIRVAGCSGLYRGPSMEKIDFANILAVTEQDAGAISPPSYIPHNSNSTYFYVIRRFNNCGYQEHTLTAAVKVSIESDSDLAQPQPNKVFASRAEQVNGNAIQLVWFYCPIEQTSQPARFNVYYDGRTGQIDYDSPLTTIDYQGRKFYSYESDALEAGKYLFAVRVENASGIENRSLAQVSIQLDAADSEPIDILSAEAF